MIDAFFEIQPPRILFIPPAEKPRIVYERQAEKVPAFFQKLILADLEDCCCTAYFVRHHQKRFASWTVLFLDEQKPF